MPHPSVDNTLSELQSRAPDAPFLALGQTVFWDEPVKAAWRRLLDRYWPSAQFVAGIHDTDYFAKTTAHVPDNEEFVALAHDDGATRGLWSAAGELSALFGSEDLPGRASFEEVGIPFDKLAGRDSAVRREFFAEYTNAYGWRGVVQTTGSPIISHDIRLSQYGEALLRLLDWGFAESLRNLDGETAEKGRAVTSAIRQWVTSYLESCQPDSTLSDLYRELLPKFYELLLDYEPSNFVVTSTASILQFNRKTAHLPRFAFIEHFLNPETRKFATGAYSSVVSGGGMYALDHFGKDALPFDVVVPGIGRGTLHVGSDNLTIDFQPASKRIETEQPVITVRQLADVLVDTFGDEVVVVGKAVSLISMLSAEFVLIFHESASGYTDRTAALNNRLRAAGIELELNPIVRLQYQTWDALKGVPDAAFRLPQHLSTAFADSGEPLGAEHFSERWRSVVQSQKQLLTELRKLRSLRDLLDFLQATGEAGYWNERRNQYENAIDKIKSNFESLADLRGTIQRLRESLEQLKIERQNLEAASGQNFRAILRPLLEDATMSDDDSLSTKVSEAEKHRLASYHDPLRHIAQSRRDLKKQLKEAAAAKRLAERTPQTSGASAEIEEIEHEANMAKLAIARSAYLTVHGLPHMNSRPTSWWLPMVDPTGTWFDNITETVEARLEEI